MGGPCRGRLQLVDRSPELHEELARCSRRGWHQVRILRGLDFGRHRVRERKICGASARQMSRPEEDKGIHMVSQTSQSIS
jgi:hypothetical protein